MDIDNFLEKLQEKRELEEERKKGPFIPILSGDDLSEVTPSQVFASLTNPFYAGVPPYPPIIDEDKWIELQCKFVETYGPELVFRVQLDTLRFVLEQLLRDDIVE